jgi:hypothetical protein
MQVYRSERPDPESKNRRGKLIVGARGRKGKEIREFSLLFFGEMTPPEVTLVAPKCHR